MLVEGSETLMVWDVNSADINLIVERMELIVHHRCSQPGRGHRILYTRSKNEKEFWAGMCISSDTLIPS